MIKQKTNNRRKKGIALFEMFLLIGLSFAISVMMSENVSAATPGMSDFTINRQNTNTDPQQTASQQAPSVPIGTELLTAGGGVYTLFRNGWEQKTQVGAENIVQPPSLAPAPATPPIVNDEPYTYLDGEMSVADTERLYGFKNIGDNGIDSAGNIYAKETPAGYDSDIYIFKDQNIWDSGAGKNYALNTQNAKDAGIIGENGALTENGKAYFQGIGLENPIAKDGLIVKDLGNGKYAYDGNTYVNNWEWAGKDNAMAWDSAHPIKGVLGGKAWDGGYFGALTAGVAWAAIAYVGVKLIGGMLGLSKGMQDALSKSLAAGAFVSGTLNALGQPGNIASTGGLFSKGGTLGILGQHPFISGLAVAAVVFILTYKSTSTKTVTYTCNPWEPPLGGNDCEKCNSDLFRPCSEYRCKALGQACQLLNAGTGSEKCAWVNPKDVTSPTIEPLTNALTTGMKYAPDGVVRPGYRGVKIIDPSNSVGCMKPFTPLKFGVTLNEPARCKIDYTRSNLTGKQGFDAMGFYFGGSNLYAYNHSQIMALPSPSSAGTNASDSPILKNGNTMTMYVKCMDANGNVNEDDFVFSFCVDKSPDTTAPLVQGTSIANEGYVQYNVDQVPIEVYTNEPAKCKWSRMDRDYEGMENQMQCASNIAQINADLTYTCAGNLTAIQNQQDNRFYFRCQDYPDNAGAGNNTMQQSYALNLKGSQPLSINYIKPDGEIRGTTTVTPVTIEVKTDSGAEEGKAQCYYSPDNASGSYIQFYQTNNYISTQQLDLTGSQNGNEYTYYVRCVDAGGNAASGSTTFTLYVDNQMPIITRAYKEVPDALKIVTNEDAQCYYSSISCNYNFTEGQPMIYPNSADLRTLVAEWKDNSVYYIKCKDIYGNMPDGNACSMTVNAVDLSKKN